MPLSYRLLPEHDLIWTTATGVLTDGDVLEHKRRLVADPACHPNMRELSDIRPVSELQVTPNGVQLMAAMDSRDAAQLGDHHMALVANEDVVVGMARMYAAFTADHLPRVGVFRSLDEALRWLGLPADLRPPAV
ncbi:MAG: hypothetical protein OER21_09835 [Gemmatimonadota bacterium]|nr:hypothetical protein [Gemmatimonadota bacterium]